jgi:predicted DNA-binding protein
MITCLHFKGGDIMSMIAARLDLQTSKEFELLAKIQHKTKSGLLKEIIKKYLGEKPQNAYIKAAENIAKHEKEHPGEYADIYELNKPWK